MRGELGFFFDAETGDVAVGSSTSAGAIIAVIVQAHCRRPSYGYLVMAKKNCDQLVDQFLKKGSTCGGESY